MARMSDNNKCFSSNFCDSSKLTNCILDSGTTCHMTPRVSYFIPCSLDNMNKHIEVADGHHVIAKQKEQVQIKMCDDNGDPFIATLHNILLATDLRDRLSITLLNLEHTCLFNKGFCTV